MFSSMAQNLSAFSFPMKEMLSVISSSIWFPACVSNNQLQSVSVKLCFLSLTKICKLIDEHPDAEFILWNGCGVQIKRRLFEKYVDEYLTAI